MEKVSILHLFTAAKNPSPFDVNMAYDAGFDKIMPYTHVTLAEVSGLVQDAIFSRGPSGVKREAIFIGGRDIDLAMDMLHSAKQAMLPPFEVSVFADPSGAFTTAAALVAKVEHHLHAQWKLDLAKLRISVFGCTGPVGACSALIAAQLGATVNMVAHRSLADVEAKVAQYQQRYGVDLQVVDGRDEQAKHAVLQQTDVAFCTAAAGVEVLSHALLASASNLKMVADVNAVPPAGAAGVEAGMDGKPIAGLAQSGMQILGLGALAIGQVKYKTQQQMLKAMLEDDKKHYSDFMSAFQMARSIVKL
jgi:methylene-tetrahydromethanopterin dehydrogenase